MTQEQEIDIAMQAGRSSLFLAVWLRFFEQADHRRIFFEQKGLHDIAAEAARIRDEWQGRVDRYLAAAPAPWAIPKEA